LYRPLCCGGNNCWLLHWEHYMWRLASFRLAN
jgi:hypothetical protein